jgi:hypothetical protein
VESKAFECVLIGNLECRRSAEDLDRFIDYAMISDCAATIVVTSKSLSAQRFLVSGCSGKTDAQQMLDGIRWDSEDLGVVVVAQTLKAAGIGHSDVARVLSNNTFLPIKRNRERALGFGKEQLFLDNTMRVGHALAADPLINWIDCSVQTAEPGRYLLYAEAEGHSAALVVSPVV